HGVIFISTGNPLWWSRRACDFIKPLFPCTNGACSLDCQFSVFIIRDQLLREAICLMDDFRDDDCLLYDRSYRNVRTYFGKKFPHRCRVWFDFSWDWGRNAYETRGVERWGMCPCLYDSF